jgi:ribosomal protein S6
MNRYEGLFILDTAGKEEGIKDVIDKISADITAAGGKIETVQKMDKRAFARVAERKHNSGYYVNVVFECGADKLAQIRSRFALSGDVFRACFTRAPLVKPAAK